MAVLKIVGIAVLLAVVIVLLLAAGKPDEFRIERKVSIQASPKKILGLLDNFHAWSSWSPWEGLDPNMKRTFSGTEKGVGAVYGWDGTGQVGAGTMEITEIRDSSEVKVKLDFLKPFEAHNFSEFSLVPTGNATEVTWAMYGPNRFSGKVMQVFFNMDKMVGKEFEKGLNRLKAVSEK